MPLVPGAKFADYEILSPLGKGGMGEVFRARDPQLKREVALKAIPAAFSADRERAARFQREAEVLASLEHPNIGPIYGLAEEDGARALILALIEGPTLADRIEKGPIPEDEAVAIARQIIEALDYAHDRGVVHRDLKPANVKITPDRVVKVLDFGLAKVVEEGRASAPSPDSPTLTLGNTIAGTIMGTAAYMSPEQAVGKEADRRSDVFSFGAVLYEMLTGKRAFPGDTVGDTLASVVKSDPDWSAVKASPVVRSLLERCLVKDRRQRLQAIGEARWILDHPPAKAKQATWWPWAVAALLGIALAAVAMVHLRETPPEQPVVTTAINAPAGASFQNSELELPAVSPDGSKIVFLARTSDGKSLLWLRRMDLANAQPLSGTEGGLSPFWAPDNRQIAFEQGGSLKKLDTQGGAPVTLAALPPRTLRGGAWNRDGVILYTSGGQLLRIPAEGGTPAPAIPGPEKSSRFPAFLPDGKHFLYVALNGPLPFELRAASLEGPSDPGKVVARVGSNTVYANGRILYLRGDSLVAQTFDPERLETMGDAVPIAEGIRTDAPTVPTAVFTASQNGLLAYRGRGEGGGRLVWVERKSGAANPLGQPTDQIGEMRLSPDERTLALNTSNPGVAKPDVWLMDLSRNVKTRFTSDPDDDRSSTWMPDGSAILWVSRRNNRPGDVYRKAVQGNGLDEVFFRGQVRPVLGNVSPDGKYVLFNSRGIDAEVNGDLWVLPLGPAETRQPRKLLETPFDEREPSFSPDGRFVVYASNESGREEIYVTGFEAGAFSGGRKQISPAGGSRALWRRDGKELFYVSPEGDLMAVGVSARGKEAEFGVPTKLFGGVLSLRGILYAPVGDAQRFIVAQDGVGAPEPLTVIQNWPALLKK